MSINLKSSLYDSNTSRVMEDLDKMLCHVTPQELKEKIDKGKENIVLTSNKHNIPKNNSEYKLHVSDNFYLLKLYLISGYICIVLFLINCLYKKYLAQKYAKNIVNKKTKSTTK